MTYQRRKHGNSYGYVIYSIGLELNNLTRRITK